MFSKQWINPVKVKRKQKTKKKQKIDIFISYFSSRFTYTDITDILVLIFYRMVPLPQICCPSPSALILLVDYLCSV